MRRWKRWCSGAVALVLGLVTAGLPAQYPANLYTYTEPSGLIRKADFSALANEVAALEAALGVNLQTLQNYSANSWNVGSGAATGVQGDLATNGTVRLDANGALKNISTITASGLATIGSLKVTGSPVNGGSLIGDANGLAAFRLLLPADIPLLGTVIDVTHAPYSATGNGTTDDTGAIQAALNAGTNIYIPEGTFIISTTSLVPQSNTTIRCAGRYKTLLKAKAGETTLNLLTIWNKSNIVIEGCGFQAGGYTWSTNAAHNLNVGNPIDIQDSSNIMVRGNYFTKCHDCVSSRGSAAGGSVNRNLAVIDNDALLDHPAFSFVNIIGQDGAIISRNTVWETVAHGTDQTLEANNGLYLYYVPDGSNAEALCRGISVTDNKFFGFDANSLETINWFCPGTLVKGNTIIGYDNTDGSTGFNDHHALSCSMTGAGITNPGCSESIIEGNYVEKGDVRINAAVGTLSGVQLRGGVIKNASQAAILVDGNTSQVLQALTIEGVTIDTVDDGTSTTQTHGVGIFITGNATLKDLKIAGNTILNTDKNAIWFRSPVTHALISANLIVNPGVRAGYGNGITIDGGIGSQVGVVVEGNQIINVLSGVIGIQASGTAINLTITDNFVNVAAGGNGYNLGASTSAHFAGNQCTGAGTCVVMSGTELAARYALDSNSILPNPSASTLGGVQSLAAVASKWINQISTSGVPSATQPAESDLSFSDIITNDVSTTKHGFAPKAPNDATQFLNGLGAWSVPAGGGGGLTIGTTTISGGGAGRLLFDDPTTPGILRAAAGLSYDGANAFNISGSNFGTGDIFSIAATITNTSTGANAAALLALRVATGSGDADPYIRFDRDTTGWSLGQDTSDSDSFVLSVANFLGGSGDVFRIPRSGQFRVADTGTVSLPSYSWIADPDTGMYSPGTNALNLAVGGVALLQLLPSGNEVDISRSSPGNAMQMSIQNTDNSNGASDALMELYVGGGSAGDPKIGFRVSGGTSWSIGTDNSDSDRFKLSNATDALGTNDKLAFDTTSTAGDTAMLLWDVDNATLERVTVGAVDSGGSGFKVLRIPN